MSMPKAILDIAKVIKAEVDISPEGDTHIVIPLDNFRDETGTFIGKDVIDKGLRKLKELQTLRAINLPDLHNHILPLQSDKVEVEVDRERLNTLLSTETVEPSSQTAEAKPEITSDTKPPKQKPPEEWDLRESEGQAHLIKNGQVVLTFPHANTDKYRYFNLAWQRYKQSITYKELYETSGAKYPDKRGENWKVNDHIRATMRKLRDEFEKKKVPVTIETKKGIRVFVTE